MGIYHGSGTAGMVCVFEPSISDWREQSDHNEHYADVVRSDFVVAHQFGAFLCVLDSGGGRRKEGDIKKVRSRFRSFFVRVSHLFNRILSDKTIYRKANFVVWPLVQIINFRWIPLQAQLPFASTIGVFWTTYLSLKNDAADAALLAATSVQPEE